jgi:hypothetical protein
MRKANYLFRFLIDLFFLFCFVPALSAATIDVMIVYDSTARTWVNSNGGMNAFAADAVARLNQAADNSNVDVIFRLVHAAEVSYTYSGSVSTDLTNLQAGSGNLSVVHQWRDTYGVDLVALLVDTGSAYGTVGIGYLLSTYSGSAGYAFTVSAIQSVDISHTLTHEVGHNLGAHHSKYQTPSPGPNSALNSYSAGWYFTGTNITAYHTIMAYNSDGYGNMYAEAPLFSTPLLSYQGTVAGHAADGDNARTIRQTMDVVAAYRPSPIDLSPESAGFGVSGGIGSIAVTTTWPSFAWTATSNDSWITITSGASGIGNRTINYSVAANPTNSTRVGTITIERMSFVVTQKTVSDTWTQKADFGGTAQYYAVGFSIGDKGYIGTGYDNTYARKRDFWEYDTISDAWTQKVDFGGTARMGAVGFAIGNKGYIGTGFDTTPVIKKDFWEYDPALNAWTQKADFGGTERYQAVGFSIGNKGYIGTGFDGTWTKDFWEYDPALNAWTQKADFGGAARWNAVGFSIGIKGYIGMGYASDGRSRDFWEYDPALDIWTRKANFGGIAEQRAVGFSIGNKGYIGTGDYYTGTTMSCRDFWEYNPVSNTWTQKAPFGGSARYYAVGFSIGTKGYIGTGTDNPWSFYRDFWEYDPGASSLYADFTSAGLYQYDGTTWTQLTGAHPSQMVTTASDFYAVFTGLGLYQWNDSTWTRITDFAPTTMLSSATALYTTFPGYGLYRWNGAAWTPLTSAIPNSMVSSTSGLYANFAGYGLYQLSDTTWTKITDFAPTLMVTSGSTLYVHFVGYGIFTWNGSSWTHITNFTPTLMVTSGSTLYAHFAGYGTYKYNGSTWTLIADFTPTTMVASATTLYTYFPGYGLYQYNGATWNYLTDMIPQSMVVSGTALYVKFAGYGLYHLSGTTWVQITTADAASMVGN